MNFLIIILGIILILLAYYIYTLYTRPSTLVSNIDLSVTQPKITGDKIKNGKSATYAMGVWIYVKNMSSLGSGNIFKYTNPADQNNANLFSLDISNDGKLKASVLKNTKKIDDSTKQEIQEIIITTAMPVQTWVYVVVSVSSNYIDAYLNGKLIQSTPISGIYIPTTWPSDKSTGPTFDFPNAGTDNRIHAFITGLTRWHTPLDPQTVWTYYSQGNGNATQSLLGAAYHLNLNLQKDSSDYKYSIF